MRARSHRVNALAPSSLARLAWNITNNVLPNHARKTERVIAIRLSRRFSFFSAFLVSFAAFFSRCAASSSGVLGGLGGVTSGSS